jgi:hypothetical protein
MRKRAVEGEEVETGQRKKPENKLQNGEAGR